MSKSDIYYCFLKDRGLRLTTQRKAIIDCLAKAPKPLSAEGIFHKVKKYGREVNLATVYRTLETLMEAELVERVGVELNRAFYTICREKRHLHHIFCLSCGRSYNLPYCPYKEQPLGDMMPEEFQVTSHRYEIYGYCGRCHSTIQ